MFRFTIRDVLWLTVVVIVGVLPCPALLLQCTRCRRHIRRRSAEHS